MILTLLGYLAAIIKRGIMGNIMNGFSIKKKKKKKVKKFFFWFETEVLEGEHER